MTSTAWLVVTGAGGFGFVCGLVSIAISREARANALLVLAGAAIGGALLMLVIYAGIWVLFGHGNTD